jgi:hypothetical protein
MPHQAPLQSGDPRRVGRYRLAGRITGIPADGPIFLGSGPDGTEVTISILGGDWARDGAGRDRFAAEAAVAKRVPPFCAARILDAGLEGDDAYLVSEYVPGKSLLEVISTEGLLREAQLGPLAIGMGTGLASVHYAGLVHGSFGPEYVVMTASGPRVVEFGITPPYGTATPAADMLAWAQTVVFAASGRPATSLADLDVLPRNLRERVLDCLSPDPGARPGARATVQALIGQDDIPAGLLAEGMRRAHPGGFAGPSLIAAAVSPAESESGPPGPKAPARVPGPPWEPQEEPGPREPGGGLREPRAEADPRPGRPQAQPAAQLRAGSGRLEPGIPAEGGRSGTHASGASATGAHSTGTHASGTHATGAHGTGAHGSGPRPVSRHARGASEPSNPARADPRPVSGGQAPPADLPRRRGDGGSSAHAGQRGSSAAQSPRAGQRDGSSPRAGQRGGPSPRWGRGLRIGALAGAAALVIALIVFGAVRALGDHGSTPPRASPAKNTHSVSLKTSERPPPSPPVTPTTPPSFAGAWSGRVHQPPNDTYSVSLTLPDRSGTGTVRYATAGVAPFSCTLVLTSASDGKLTFSEASQGSCAAGTVTLTRSGASSATYEFRGGGLVATGSLTRS